MYMLEEYSKRKVKDLISALKGFDVRPPAVTSYVLLHAS